MDQTQGIKTIVEIKSFEQNLSKKITFILLIFFLFICPFLALYIIKKFSLNLSDGAILENALIWTIIFLFLIKIFFNLIKTLFFQTYITFLNSDIIGFTRNFLGQQKTLFKINKESIKKFTFIYQDINLDLSLNTRLHLINILINKIFGYDEKITLDILTNQQEEEISFFKLKKNIPYLQEMLSKLNPEMLIEFEKNVTEINLHRQKKKEKFWSLKKPTVIFPLVLFAIIIYILINNWGKIFP